MATTERPGAITFKGNPMTLVGPELSVGDAAPSATLTSQDMAAIDPLTHGAGKSKLVITVPSVDTSVCSLESKKFSDALKNDSAASQHAVYVISADLPFALKRWCAAEGVDNLTLLSDYRGLSLANAWGLHIKELDLLARAVYVLDKNNTVVYREIVPEVGSEPDYDAALTALRDAE